MHARASIILSESLGYLSAFDEAFRLNRAVRTQAQANDKADLHAFSLYKLGILHLQRENWARADSAFRSSLSMANSLGNLEYQRRILRDLGRLHELQEQWSAAEEYYRDGVAVIERYRESLTASQWSATAFSQWQDIHRGLVRVLLAQNQNREALSALDRTRARHLQNLRTQSRVANQLSSEGRARLDSLTEALTTVRSQMSSGVAASKQAALRDQEAELMAARRSLLDLEASPTRPSIDSLSSTLQRQGRGLVSYFLDDPWPIYDRPPRSTAFVLVDDSLRAVPLDNASQDSIRTHVRSISPLFTSEDTASRVNAMHFDLRPLHSLHELLYTPVAEHLPDNRSLTVVPDGPLFRVPFSALVDQMPGGRYAPGEARFLLHERPVATELASSLVVATPSSSLDRQASDPRLSAFGVSTFDTLRTVPSALQSALPQTASDSSLILPSLPGVQSELDAVRQWVDEASVSLDTAATESAVQTACQRGGVLHIASHAFVHPASPLQNAFLLHPDSTSSASAPSDGVLFLHELRAHSRPLPLVVLSGCSTARGTLRGGEGMSGLQYGFRAMGAQATISNMWPAADRASVALMDGFYRHLRDGRAKDEALRQAKLSYLQNHPHQASPFFWASTVLYGDPQPLNLGSSSYLPAWARGGLATLLLLGTLLAWAWHKGLLSEQRRKALAGSGSADSS